MLPTIERKDDVLFDENAASHIAFGDAYSFPVGEADLSRINASAVHIDFMIGSDEVDVTGIAPLTGAANMALAMREDVVTDGGYPDKILSNAPERIGDFYAVPKVVE